MPPWVGVCTSLMRRLMREVGMKGGVILFHGSGAAARRYVEADRSRADEYYLGADDAVAEYAVFDGSGEVTTTRSFSADEYEACADWINSKRASRWAIRVRPRRGTKGSPLFAEMTINAPKSLSSLPRCIPRSPKLSMRRSRMLWRRFVGCWVSTRHESGPA